MFLPDQPLTRSDEVQLLSQYLRDIASMDNFCRALRRRYSFGKTAFTETELLQAIVDVLFYCRDVDRARIYLPFPIVGPKCGVATRVLANALKALASRPEEDSAPLTILVVDNVSDHTLCELWMNPTDVRNMITVLPTLETLVLTVRRQGSSTFPAAGFGVALWSTVFHAAKLKGLCLSDSRVSTGSEGVVNMTTVVEMDHVEWLESGLPGPNLDLPPPPLTYLELKHISIPADDLLRIAKTFGPTLEELYLNNVLLMTQQSQNVNVLSDEHLWVGLPNQNPGPRLWLAMRFRALMPNLRVCRCSYLGYKLFVDDDSATCDEFDYLDPSGLGRSVSQRFVEVLMGIRQPRLLSGDPLFMHPHDARHDDLLHDLRDRKTRMRISEHDYHAHRLMDEHRLPDYQYSIDGLFRNCTNNSVREMQYITDRIHEGVNAVQDGVSDGMEELVDMMPDLFSPNVTPAAG